MAESWLGGHIADDVVSLNGCNLLGRDRLRSSVADRREREESKERERDRYTF